MSMDSFPDIPAIHNLLSQLNPEQKKELIQFIASIRDHFYHLFFVFDDVIENNLGCSLHSTEQKKAFIIVADEATASKEDDKSLIVPNNSDQAPSNPTVEATSPSPTINPNDLSKASDICSFIETISGSEMIRSGVVPETLFPNQDILIVCTDEQELISRIRGYTWFTRILFAKPAEPNQGQQQGQQQGRQASPLSKELEHQSQHNRIVDTEEVFNYSCELGLYSGHVVTKKQFDLITGFIPHGAGKLYSDEDENFLIYEGDFKGGVFHGQGIWYNKPASEVQNILRKAGTFENGSFVEGTMSYQSGDSYTGSTEMDEKSTCVPHGKGQMSYINGDLYEGEWCFGMFEGLGKLTNSLHKYIYQGHFQDGLRHGFGIMMNLDSTKLYEGYSEKGVRHGKIKHFHKSYSFTSNYTKGEEDPSKIEAISDEYSIVIKGPCLKNSYFFYGRCHVSFPDCTYNGFIERNVFALEGMMEWHSGPNQGVKFNGIWKDHHFHHGTLTYPDGSKYYGYFDDFNRRFDPNGTMMNANGSILANICFRENKIIQSSTEFEQQENDYSQLCIKIPSLHL